MGSTFILETKSKLHPWFVKIRKTTDALMKEIERPTFTGNRKEAHRFNLKYDAEMLQWDMWMNHHIESVVEEDTNDE